MFLLNPQDPNQIAFLAGKNLVPLQYIQAALAEVLLFDFVSYHGTSVLLGDIETPVLLDTLRHRMFLGGLILAAQREERGTLLLGVFCDCVEMGQVSLERDVDFATVPEALLKVYKVRVAELEKWYRTNSPRSLCEHLVRIEETEAFLFLRGDPKYADVLEDPDLVCTVEGVGGENPPIVSVKTPTRVIEIFGGKILSDQNIGY